ncbi:MAG TPA: hypothetical protein PK587_11270 [Syntrophales bacterium]|nr:hypothetical protein [Syntrophales bacterium]
MFIIRILALALAAFSLFPEAAAADYIQVPAVMDTRTTFSDGAYSVEELVLKAREKGIGALFINDHDLMVMGYGIPPLRGLLKKRVEQNSILKQGPDGFLHAIKAAADKYPDTIVIPGTESTPFYYWTGNIWNGLTAHDPEKRILTIGLEKPEDYRGLPVIHNFPRKRINVLEIILFGGALAVSIALLRWRGAYRLAGFAVMAVCGVFIINGVVSENNLYDPYGGKKGIEPYQRLIDYVGRRGGMTFWNYPETRSGVRQMGPVRVSTQPYPDALIDSKRYTGFASIYGDRITVTDPGGVWDIALMEFCKGFRDTPPWGIATSDFHREEESGSKLGDFQTVFLVREKNKKEILSALKHGKFYAALGRHPKLPRLDEFSAASPDGNKAFSGDNVIIKGIPHVRVAVSGTGRAEEKATVRLIRSGRVVRTLQGTLPLALDYEDTETRPGEMVYYRMDMQGFGNIVSNPIFLRPE